MTRNASVLALVFAGIIWGFGFIATVWGLKELTPIQFVIERMLIAMIAGLPFLYFFRAKSFFDEFKFSFLPGLCLGIMQVFQTQGLLTTSATNSGFITCMYVVFLPVLHFAFSRVKPNKIILISLALGVAGTYWISGGNFQSFNEGDLWTLACAFFGALQILFLGYLSPKSTSAYTFNYFQTFWCVIVTLPFMLGQEVLPLPVPKDNLVWYGLFATAIGSTLIGFALQVQAQKVLSPVLASLLCLLEAPFAMIFGIILLGEHLGFARFVGAALIFVAAILAVLSELRPALPSASSPRTKSR